MSILLRASGQKARKHKVCPLTAVIPVGITDIDKLSTDSGLVPDRLRVLLHQIYVLWIYDELNDKKREDKYHKEGWVTLSAKRLQCLLTKNYKLYETYLEEKGIIEIGRNNEGGKSYVEKERCTPYRISPQLLKPINGRKFRHEKITDYKTLVSIKNDKSKFESELYSTDVVKVNSYCTVHEKMNSMLTDFYFDTEGLGQYLTDLESGKISVEKDSLKGLFDAEMMVHLINEKSVPQPIVCNFGERFHSSFVRLPKEYRPFLRLKNNSESLASIDISNCQVFLISLMLSYPDEIKIVLPEFEFVLDKLKTIKYTKARYFLEISSKGRAYEFWTNARAELTHRNQAKTEIIERVLFNSASYQKKEYEHIRIRFEELFPDVWEAIVMMKSITEKELPIIKELFLDKKKRFGGKKFYHKTISCMCQRLESRIITGMIVPALIKKNLGPFLTIHDSIVLPESKASIVENTIIDCFKRLGVMPPTVKKKTYKPISSAVDQ